MEREISMARQMPQATPEQRAAGLAKAAENRLRRKAEREAAPLRTVFVDSPRWDELAAATGDRLAPWGEPPTPEIIKKYLRRYNVSSSEYKDWFGEGDLGSFQRLNPTWPMRALCGLILEGINVGIIKKDLRGGAAPNEVQAALVF